MTLVGVVLTGGASRRMGRNKALIDVDGVPMASVVAEALGSAGCETVVALGGDLDELAALDIVVLADEYPGQGPLGGVISALGSAPGSPTKVAVVACDFPWLRSTDLSLLIEAAGDQPSVDVVVARTDRLQPACAIWDVSCLPAIRAVFARGDRSLRAAIDRLSSVEVLLPDRALHNVNTPSALER